MASRADVERIVNPLLQTLPASPGLADLQQFYRSFIFDVGYYILGQFPTAAGGQSAAGPLPGGPIVAGGPGKGYQPSGGPGKGYQPGAFATLVLGLPWD